MIDMIMINNEYVTWNGRLKLIEFGEFLSKQLCVCIYSAVYIEMAHAVS